MILPKGYRLKHGTSFRRIGNIVVNGIQPGHFRNDARTAVEAEPLINGVYVGYNLSYYGASLSFTSFMHDSLYNQKKVGDIPIVIEIELGEDCNLAGDEDNVFELKDIPKDEQIDYLLSQSEKVWKKYQSGALVDQEIPVSWIKKMEYPLIKDYQNISTNKKSYLQFDQDISVLSLAYWQYKTNASVTDFEEMLLEFKKKNNFSGHFTNVVDFNHESVSILQNLNIVKNESKLYEYAIMLWREFTARLNILGLDHINEPIS